MQTTTTLSHPVPPDVDASIRGWADVLGLWRLCRNTACARVCACRGKSAYQCFRVHFQLLPDSLQLWFEKLKEAQREGISYDEALERMQDTLAENALEQWHEAIVNSQREAQANKG